jgi:hypothetical protein
LRKINYRTPLAVGFMVGVGVMFVNTMLLVAVVSGANFARWGIGASPSSQQATEAFAILLFLAYVRGKRTTALHVPARARAATLTTVRGWQNRHRARHATPHTHHSSP